MRAARCLVLFLLLFATDALHAQHSSVDTLYADTTLIHSGSYDLGDTIWVGIGTANTFAVGAMSYRFELEDTNRIVPVYSVDTISGALKVLLRLVNRGLAFDTPHAVTSVIIPHADTAHIIRGVLIDFAGTDSIPVGTGTILEIAFLAKAGIQLGDSTRILVIDNLTSGIVPRNSLSNVGGTLSVLPQLRSGIVRFGPPGDVLFDIVTSTGNDTLFVGRPGQIHFTVDANGNDVASLSFPFEMVFSAGNVIGPISDGAGDISFSEAAIAAFESRNWNLGYGQGTDPDTALVGVVDFGGPLWDGSGTVWTIDVFPSGSGNVRFDTIFLPPVSGMSAVDVDANDIPIQYLFDGKVIEFVPRPADPVVTIEGLCPTYGHTYEGGGVAVHVLATPQLGAFVSLDLVSISRDGNPAVPINTPDVTGLGLIDAPDAEELILYWESAAGEAGAWEFCFLGLNDIGDSGTACYSVDIRVPDGDHVAWKSQHYEYLPGGSFPETMSNTTTHGFDSTYGIVLPFVLTSAAGGAFFDAPILDDDMAAGISPGYVAAFGSRSTNSYGNDATSPDSMLYGMIYFGGPPLFSGTYQNDISVSLKATEGIIAIDTIKLLPANEISFNVTNSFTVVPSYSPGCWAVTIVRNIPPTLLCQDLAVAPVIFGDPVQVSGFSYIDPDNAPGPYAFSVVSAEKDGVPSTPTNAPVFTGDTFDWQTSNITDADAGLWRFCLQVFDGADASVNICCFEVEVISQFPLVCFSFGCVDDVPTGTDICVPLLIDNIDDNCKELGGFDLLFTYDASLLTFMGIDLVGSVLEAEGWEYFTYRIVSTNPAKIRIVSIADMNNSNQHPSSLCLDGLLANICFKTTTDLSSACQSAHIQFCWDDCGDNTASSPDGDSLYIITDPNGLIPWAGGDPFENIAGGGIINNSCSIESQWATFDGGITGPADFPCIDDDPSKPDPIECLYFVNGKIKIYCPGEIGNRGDLNLNGLAYEIADAVVYHNIFIMGPIICIFPPCNGLSPDAIAASDVNADGVPLTVADLVYLILVILGQNTPIPDGLLDGGPRVATIEGSVDIATALHGSEMTITTSSETDMGAALFVFKYDFMDISEVTVTNRASDMDVSFHAEDGELRVLVDNIEDGASIPAGSGEILTIKTMGTGSIKLVSVEAASSMGGILQSNISARVTLPTTFALHQNYPNPFNPSTSFAIDLPKTAEYTLSVYNISGQLVKSFSGQADAGTLKIVWDGKNNGGTSVASGVYFYRFRSSDFNAVRKMVLMK